MLVPDEPALARTATGLGAAHRLEVMVLDEPALTGAAAVGRPAIGLVIRVLDESALAALRVHRAGNRTQGRSKERYCRRPGIKH